MVNQPSDIGVLFRGATGRLWLMRGNATAPVEITDSHLNKSLMKFLPEQSDQSFSFPVPQEVRALLDEEIGPLWWCWVFCSAARMK